jgi:hypothetical protein
VVAAGLLVGVRQGRAPLATDSERQCEPDSKRCRWPEQVFIDGRQLTQVAAGTIPNAGQFALGADREVILGESPHRQDRRSDRA